MLYLASESSRRAKLLREAGVRFKKLKASYHEARHRHLGPAALVKKHALGKALAAAKTISAGRILAADTLVYFKGRTLGKPGNYPRAVRMLRSLQGRAHTVYTGVALLERRAGRTVKKKVFFQKTEVYLKKMDEKRIHAYFRRIDPLDKAGAYAIQDLGAGIVEKVEGSFTNAVGLPMERLGFL